MVSDSRDVLTRPAPPPERTIRYGGTDDHVADLWGTPDDRTPLVVVIHGGFWRAEYDRRHTGPLCAGLRAAGFAVAAIEYRRTGMAGGGWPGTFDDVAAAVTDVPVLVGTDPERSILLGHSAGGHLALWAAAGQARRGHPPRGVVALAPVADLHRAYLMDLDDGAVATLLGGGPAEQPDRYLAADPIRLVPVGTPTVVVHGTEDSKVPVGLSRAYVDAARQAGEDVTYCELPDTGHFAVIDPQSPAWPAVVGALHVITMV